MTIGFQVHPSHARISKEIIAALAPHATSNLCDSMGRTHNVSSTLRPMHRGGRLCGPALTVRTAPGDNLLVHKAIDLAQPGDVIVVDGGGYTEAALIGDIMTSYALTRRVAGFVIDTARCAIWNSYLRATSPFTRAPFPLAVRRGKVLGKST